ncbi:hypothetical protein [Anderseniella sp. Alg231-50]|uniref:hypothetical protein n=1 Tax=Anderseniella sp. Alg231-50 TaxID=1922226 RepID=UPI000D55D2AC
MNLLKQHLQAILRSITAVGVMIIALDLFQLAWPYKLIIGSIVLFIVFSFTGICDDDNEIHNDRR